jgi:putative addiction module CopG family antidote
MSITLTPEDQKKAEALVASGRFSSVSEALHAGLEAIEAGRTVPLEEVLEMLRAARLQKA